MTNTNCAAADELSSLTLHLQGRWKLILDQGCRVRPCGVQLMLPRHMGGVVNLINSKGQDRLQRECPAASVPRAAS
ncbi:hypothetical protein MHYP_G00217510 [Metynnis hypsauchen]